MQIISLAGLIGKNAMTLASEQVPKSTQFVNSLQRKFIRSISRNIIQLLQQTAPDEVITVQKYLREIEKYGLTQGECKFLLSNDADILEKLVILADEKLIKAVSQRKNIIQEGCLDYVTKENKKAFIQLLEDKKISDEQFLDIAHLITAKSAPILKRLLKSKTFNRKLLQDLPSTHLRADNYEVLKQISKNGNVSTQEMLYIMTNSNKSNSDIAVKLLKKCGKNSEGLNSILRSVYSYEGMSEEGLRAVQLRKKLLSDLLENPDFKLGTDSKGMENFLISKVLSAVTTQNYEVAKTVLLRRNITLNRMPEFLSTVTVENRNIAKRIVDLSSEDVRLPDLRAIDADCAEVYLDEIAKINNKEARNFYIGAMDDLNSYDIDEILNIIKTSKPEDAKYTSALVSLIPEYMGRKELESIIDAIKKSGRNLDYLNIKNIASLSYGHDIRFIEKLLNNKTIPDYELRPLLSKYINKISDIRHSKFVLPSEVKQEYACGSITDAEYKEIKEFLYDEFIQIQNETIERLPEVLDTLLTNKNLSLSDAEYIFSAITADNLSIIEKYAGTLQVKFLKNIDLKIANPDNFRELKKLAKAGVSSRLQRKLLPFINTDEQLGQKRFNALQQLLKRKSDINEDDIYTVLFNINNSNMQYVDEIIARQDFTLEQIKEILREINQGKNIDNLMKLIKDKNVKGEYISEMLEDSVFKLYEQKPELVKRMMDFNFELSVINPKNFMQYIPITEIIGEKQMLNIIKSLEKAKKQYGIFPEKLSFEFPAGFANDLYITLSDTGIYGRTVYKFDKKTGNLVCISQNGKTLNVSTGNTIEDIVSSEEKISQFSDVPYLIQTITKGKNGNAKAVIYTESVVKGQYEIYKTSPDGSKVRIGHALFTPNGSKHIKRTLTSLDGSKTYLAFREDKAGNSYFHSVIADKTGKILSDVKRTFKVISKNHFISSKNGQSYDIVFTDKKVAVTKLDSNGKKTKEAVEFIIRDIPVNTADEILNKLEPLSESEIYKVAGIFKNYGIEPGTIDRSCVNALKHLPGDEWFAMSKSCEFVMPQTVESGNALYAGNSIFISQELSDNLGMFCHELGHAKFITLDLARDKQLLKIYNAEKKAYTGTFPESRINSVDYFLIGNRTGMNGLEETAAETNLLTDTIQTFEQIQDRTIFLEQYFPKTIAYIRQKYEKLS